ncbi:MAG: pyruvate kinase [Armatimonadetes bacterium]|nr:pyruvate kinase [Armatimonadota bacterium]
MKRTKIVCTIGPASDNVEILVKMMQAGMNVARLNFSHGTREEHARRIELIREAAGKAGKNIALLLDTKGPEIRLGVLEKPVHLRAKQKVVLTARPAAGEAGRLPVLFPDLPRKVSPGSVILIADGLIELKVLSVQGDEVECEVVHGGEVTSHKGVSIPDAEVDLPAVTAQDREDILFGVERRLDFIAVSFVRRAADVLAVREILEEAAAGPDVIAKIESREGVNNLDEIIAVADGVMVARGDLGVDIPAEEVPLVQKMIIKKCNQAGKPVITATQMLESMIHNPRPSRAEASDVANAIFDGTDAVMLSGETAVGRYPVEAVEVMARIAARAEAALPYAEILERQRKGPARTVTDAISHATCAAAQDLGAAAIITSTQTGYTAKMVSKYRPRAPIIAVTPEMKVLRKLALVWGVQPLLIAPIKDTDSMIAAAIEISLAAEMVKPGDLVVITAGVPVGMRGTTNLLKVHAVGDILARGAGIGQRTVTGRVRVCRTPLEAREKIEPGDILVAPATDADFVPAMEKCAAIITEVGGLTSHAVLVGLEFGIPVIVGVDAAASIFTDGEVVTVDGRRGLVYRGVTRAL